MNGHKRILLTIITESSLEAKLTSEIEKLGAHGYTIVDCRGKGSHGARDADWDYDRNIRLEVICPEETAQAIANHLRDTYYKDFAMVTFTSEIAVWRPEKF